MALALVDSVSLLTPAPELMAVEVVDSGLAEAWQRARTAWLQVKGAASAHTSRAYDRALADFESYIAAST